MLFAVLFFGIVAVNVLMIQFKLPLAAGFLLAFVWGTCARRISKFLKGE